MPLPYEFEAEAAKGVLERDTQTGLARNTADSQRLDQRYGVDANGNLNWSEQQVDPFSVTATIARQFRQQRDAQKYGQFSGGFGYDGSSGLEAAHLATDQQGQQHTIANAFTDQRSDLARSREDITNNRINGLGTIDAQLARAFAEDPARRVSTDPAPAAEAAAPEAAAPAPAGAAPGNLIKRPSAAHGGKMWLYRVGASGKLIPVRPA